MHFTHTLDVFVSDRFDWESRLGAKVPCSVASTSETSMRTEESSPSLGHMSAKKKSNTNLLEYGLGCYKYKVDYRKIINMYIVIMLAPD